ncbi:MAG: proline racemase [Chloroflexota bacterium]|nr:proline racemase [Chloroflexota bacterium]
MQSQQPVIRTYRGRDRRSAEQAYRLDAEAAERATWYPVAHRWASSWAGHELSVVFEFHGIDEDGTPTGFSVATSAPESGYEYAPVAEQASPLSPTDDVLAWAPEADAGAAEDVTLAAGEKAVLPEIEDAPGAYPQVEFAAEYDVPAASEYGLSAAADPGVAAEPRAEAEPESSPEPKARIPTYEWSPPPQAPADAAPLVSSDPAWEPEADEPDAPAELEPPAEPMAWAEIEIETAPEARDAQDASTDREAAADDWAGAASDGETTRNGVAGTLADLDVWAEPSLADEAASEAETTAEAEAEADSMAGGPSDSEAPTWAERDAAATESAAASSPVEAPRTSATPAVRAHARAVVQTIDLHCAGEPLRLIRSGFPPVPSLPILERRRWLRENADYARRVLMFEPRGHRDMYGAILLPPHNEDADVAVLFMHNQGYSTMCGHGTIAIATALVEEGLYPATAPETTIRFETPAGIVTAVANVLRMDDDRNEVTSVRFRNVPSYLHASGLRVRPDGVPLAGRAAEDGQLSVDLAFGGAYYGVVDAADLGMRVVPAQAQALTRAGAAITEILRRDHTPSHPTERDLGFVYGTIIVDRDPASSPDGKGRDADMRNVTIFADAEVDRSPCGSGTSALLARLHAIGQLETGQSIVNAGITGETFRGRVEEETFLGPHRAVVTTVEGSAYVTGYQTFVVDDRDPLGGGFLLP